MASNIIIYAVEGYADLADQIRALLAALDGAEIVAVTSELTVAEVLVKPLKDQNHITQQAYKTFLTPTPVLQLVPVSHDVLEEAARLRASTALKLPDAIHLATANLDACDSFLTNDDLFKSVGEANIKILSAAGVCVMNLTLGAGGGLRCAGRVKKMCTARRIWAYNPRPSE